MIGDNWNDFIDNMELIEYAEELKIEHLALHGYWATANGDELRIKDMDTDHLINALRFIQRNEDEFILNLYEDQFKNELRRRGYKAVN